MSGRHQSAWQRACAGASAARCPPLPGQSPHTQERLRPRPHAPREHVAASQRERLQGAMIAAVGTHGYEGASVDQIVALAGTSTKTLYRQFGSKLDCFLSTCDLLYEAGAARIAASWRLPAAENVDAELLLGDALEAFMGLPAAKPAHARAALVEIMGVGPRAIECIERAEEIFAPITARALARARPDAAPPPAIACALVHGLWHLQRARIFSGAHPHTDALTPALLQWMLCHCHPEATGLLEPAAARAGTQTTKPLTKTGPLTGVGANTTLLAHLARERDPRRRALLATAQIVAQDGYAKLSIPAIAARAELSIDALLDIFADVERCFLATLEMLCGALVARGLRAAQEAPGWEQAVCALTRSVLDQIGCEPMYARVCFVEIFAAGPAAAEHRTQLLSGLARLLMGRLPRGRLPRDSSLQEPVAEAIVGSVWGVIHGCLHRGEARNLSQLSGQVAYLLLAPVLGAEQALRAIARDRGA